MYTFFPSTEYLYLLDSHVMAVENSEMVMVLNPTVTLRNFPVEAGPPGTFLSPKEISRPTLMFRGLEDIEA